MQVLIEPGLDYQTVIVYPLTSEYLPDFAELLFQLRQRKGVTFARAKQEVLQPNFFGPLMVKSGKAEAFLSGLTYDYPDVIRPALPIFHTRTGTRKASGVYLITVHNQVYLFTDSTVTIERNAG